MTDLSLYLPCEYISPTDNLSDGKFLHMTICQVEEFLHMADFLHRHRRFSPQAPPVVPVTNIRYAGVRSMGPNVGY